MNIHLINPYATLPNEGWRKYRTNILAEQLAKSKHNVTLWISNIDHRSKTRRSKSYESIHITDNFKIEIIPSLNYARNASIGRILYERNFAKNVSIKFIENRIESDCIIVTDPCLFIGDIIIDIVKQTDSKLIVDVLDIWPEVFQTLFPKPFRWISDILFYPLYQIRNKIYRKADGIVAVTKDYLEIVTKCVKNKPKLVAYIGIDFTEITINSLTPNFILPWAKKNDEQWIIYAGTLGLNYDIKSIMEFAEKLEKSTLNCKLLIAGDGPLKDYVINKIGESKLIKTIYLGRLNFQDLNFVYSKCDIAFSTYLESSSVSMPVKAYDCMAFGLPIVNSLKRELGSLVLDYNIGVQYKPQDSNDLFEKTESLLVNHKLLQSMKKNSMILSKKFSIESQYTKFINFIETILKNEDGNH